MNYVDFDFGEIRHIKILINSCENGNRFEIEKASYKLFFNGENIPESEGASIVFEHTIDQVISPKKIGKYILQITYYIADEILIEKIEVRVR